MSTNGAKLGILTYFIGPDTHEGLIWVTNADRTDEWVNEAVIEGRLTSGPARASESCSTVSLEREGIIGLYGAPIFKPAATSLPSSEQAIEPERPAEAVTATPEAAAAPEAESVPAPAPTAKPTKAPRAPKPPKEPKAEIPPAPEKPAKPPKPVQPAKPTPTPLPVQESFF